MSGFDAGWLALREPFDRAAREASALRLDWPALAARLRGGRDAGAALQVVDLGCGTGSSLRALAPRLGGRQHWQLLDHDPALLAALPQALSTWAVAQGCRVVEGDGLAIEGEHLQLTVAWQRADLADLAGVTALDGAQLVTASALLDLVSAAWLQALVARCRAAGAAVGWALSVDDRLQWQPADGADEAVHAHFRAHQRRDKGFGPALGGGAVAEAVRLLRRAGYRVATAPSDWQVDGERSPADRAMLREMVDGLAIAALEQAPEAAPAVQAWRLRRQAQRAATRLQVGHTDLLAWL